MIRVSTVGLDVALAKVSGMAKQLRYATAVALTRTARAVKDALPALMERELDRPTTFTKRGLFVQPAKTDNLQAVVGFMDRQAGYMKYQIEGGTRAAGPRGIKLPGNIQLNTFGNIPRGVIDQLKAAAKDGRLSSTIRRRLGVTGNRRKGAAQIELFFGKPAGAGWDNAPIGIWRRIPGSPGKLVPVVLFEDSPARYRPRFHFRRAAEAIVSKEWDKQFAKAFEEAIRTAR